MATRPPHLTQRPRSVVVVPNGSPLGCLRKDMVSDLVFEVWIMVSQGLPHHHPQEFSYIRPPDVTVRIQCTYLIYRINDYTMPKCRRLGQ